MPSTADPNRLNPGNQFITPMPPQVQPTLSTANPRVGYLGPPVAQDITKPQFSAIPLNPTDTSPNHGLAQWMSNYMSHVGFHGPTGMPVYTHGGKHYIPQAMQSGGTSNNPAPQASSGNGMNGLPESGSEPPPDGTGGNDYGTPTPTPPITVAPPNTGAQPWENQSPFFEGGYNSIPNPNGTGFVPNLGGAQTSFNGNPSMYETSWSFQPGLGWIPAAQAAGVNGPSMGYVGYEDDGNPDTGRNGGTFGRIWQHTPPGAIGHVLGNIIRGFGPNNNTPETPAQRARGDNNWGMAGGSIPGASFANNSHYNWGTGRYEADRETGPGFSSSPNQGAEQQTRDPVKFGMHTNDDSGISSYQMGATGRRIIQDPYTGVRHSVPWARLGAG